MMDHLVDAKKKDQPPAPGLVRYDATVEADCRHSGEPTWHAVMVAQPDGDYMLAADVEALIQQAGKAVRLWELQVSTRESAAFRVAMRDLKAQLRGGGG